MRQEATLSFAFAYIIMFIIIVIVFIVGIPFMLQVNTAMHSQATNIYNMGLGYANQIQNTTVKTAMVNLFNTNKAALTTSQYDLGKFAQYGWVLIIIIVAFVVFVLARRSEMISQSRGII